MKNFFNSISKLFILLILLFIYVFLCAYSYASTTFYDLSDNVFRLHIIANSDSEEDQNLKYIVRDNLIQYMNSICSNATSKEECIEIVSNHLSDFSQIANETILANGFSYSATTELGNFEFPTKNYADITFPSGYYDALEVKLGNADGKNWWCVLYPSLCFIDTTSGFIPEDSKETLEDNLDTESYELISNNNDVSLSFKFKLIEFFNKNKFINTAKN